MTVPLVPAVLDEAKDKGSTPPSPLLTAAVVVVAPPPRLNPVGAVPNDPPNVNPDVDVFAGPDNPPRVNPPGLIKICQ